jgi:hypothetical protein
VSRAPRPFDSLLAEARRHLVPDSHGPDHDWSAADAALHRRLAEGPGRSPSIARRPPIVAIASGVALAAAAAATLVFRPLPAPVRSGTTLEIAGSVDSIPGPGALRVVGASGELRGASSPIHVGDRLATAAEDVSFVSRSDVGALAVAWRVERESTLLVTRARAPLGLTLESGAVEADVAKVARGEAFVVDVGPVRVAVKGTHLRVARSGDRASVDLTEGTIAIGPIPEAGLTEGKLVRAPAHVELDLVRPDPVRLVGGSETVRARAFDHDSHVVAGPARGPIDAPAPAAPTDSAASSASPSPSPIAPPPSASVSSAVPSAAAPARRMPAEIVREAVAACIAKNIPAGPVRVVISSSLTVEVDRRGVVKVARFDPPLSPEVEACASSSIYETHFAGVTTERISIVVER